MPPCWWRRPAPARPRGFRWCSPTRTGRRTAASWCWSRAGSPRAPPPSAWRTTLGERVGETVGLRVRFGSKVSRKTRIEIVTEGIFTRLILDDPMLDGVAAVLFDEFHERSLDADLGLALARDAQQGLREDLKLLVMSATIDGARVAALLGDAPVIESEGRAFPVETRYVGRDARPIEPQVADIDRAGDARRSRLAARVPARRRRNPPHAERSSKAASIRRPTSCRSTARSPATSRIAPSRPPRPAAARSCWRPRSRKPRSPSRACASSSIAGLRGCRATSPMSA